uniref:Uncharacterized protein n=1 Tax=Oryza rufipogon TaxID=4529 RepID=A0A0E0Q645_ORYRU
MAIDGREVEAATPFGGRRIRPERRGSKARGRRGQTVGGGTRRPVVRIHIDHIGGEERVEALAAGRWGRRRRPDPCPRGQIRVLEADSVVVVGGHRRRRSSLAPVTPSSWRSAVGD